MSAPEAGPLQEPSFDEPWQAEVFALAVALNERGLFGWGEWVRAVAAQPKGAAYADWLAALEQVLAAKGIAAPDEISGLARDWQASARATPHGRPIELRRGAAQAK